MQVRNLGLKLIALSTPLLGSVSAFAQAAPAFTSAVTAETANIAIYGAALVGVAAVGVGFMIGMKYVKKISRAA